MEQRAQSGIRHFLDLEQLDTEAARHIIGMARTYKHHFGRGDSNQMLRGQRVALLLERPATRTRLFFEIAVRDLGGEVISLFSQDLMTSRGESLGDTARVLSRHLDYIVYRAERHSRLLEFANNSTSPVINGLSDRSHPFRTLVDVMTYEELRGPIKGRRVVLLGDCSQNTCSSWIQAAALFGCKVVLSHPDAPQYKPLPEVLEWARAHGGDVTSEPIPERAVCDSDYIVTDTWFPMGAAESPTRTGELSPYRVDAAMLAHAASDALFMHPLPAYREHEVTAEVIDGPQSVTWKGGIENKRFILPALFAWLREK
jgi:ornithine carbamoyltransferase